MGPMGGVNWAKQLPSPMWANEAGRFRDSLDMFK